MAATSPPSFALSVQPVGGDLAGALVRASLEAIVVFDSAGRIVFFNPAAERTFGRAASEVQGALFAEVIFAPTYRAIFLAEMEEYRRSGDTSAWADRMDARGIRADGESFPCEFTLVPLVVEGAVQFAAYIRDITDRRSTEHGLRAAHEELERQVEHRTAELSHAVTALKRAQATAHLGNVEIDLETGRRTWSSEVFGILGFDESQGEPEFSAVLSRVHPEDRPRVERSLTEGFKGKPWEPFDYRNVLPGGAVRWIRCAGQVFHDPITRKAKLSSTVQDVTQQNEVSQALRRTTQRLTRAQAVARMGFVDIDRRRGVRIWSPEMFALFAFPPSAKPPSLEAMLSRVHPLDQIRIRTIFDRSYATGELAGLVEFRLLLPDGTVRWVRNVAQHEGGDTDRIMSIYLDITDLKEAQEAAQRRSVELVSTVAHLERTRERLERAQRLAKVGDAERYVGSGHRVWSVQMLVLHGFEPSETTPSRDEVLARVHPEDREHMREALQAADTGEEIPPFDYRVLLPSGALRWLRVHTEISQEPDKGRVRVSSSTFDVTEQKAAELEMIKALERERELGRLKADFLHMVTHEYRTPLGIIVAAAQILERYHERMDVEERKQQLADIRGSARRLADLMEEILFLGKTEAGGILLDLEPFDVVKLVNEVIHEVRTSFGREREIHLEMSPQKTALRADQKLLRHILTNLLSNALKYSPSPRPVELDVRDETDALVFTVRDQGIGVPLKDQPRLFDMFRRGSNVGAISGTGLGLVVVKRCVDLHGGTVTLKSSEGQGTEVSVRLPHAPAVPHRVIPAFPR